MLEELIKMFPKFEKDILDFDDYIKNYNPEIVDLEWHLRTYPEEMQFYFVDALIKKEFNTIRTVEEYSEFKKKYKDYPFIDNYLIDFALTEERNIDSNLPDPPQSELIITI